MTDNATRSVYVAVTQYSVTCIPEDVGTHGRFDLHVEHRGNGAWAVLYRGQCLSEC